MSYYLASFSPVKANIGRVMVSRSASVARKAIKTASPVETNPVNLDTIHRVISNHVTSTSEDLVLAHDISMLAAEIRDFAVTAGIGEEIDAQFDTVAYCSCVKRGDEWARGFILDEEEQHICAPVMINKQTADEKMEGLIFLSSAKRTVFINAYDPRRSPMRNQSKLFAGDIKGTPLTGLEMFMALAYSAMYAKSGPALKARFDNPSSVRPEFRAFYASLQTLQALLNLLANVGNLQKSSLTYYSERPGRRSEAEENVRQIVGRHLMKRMEKELKAANSILRPDEITAITEEELDLFDRFTVTSGAKA